MKFEYLKMSEKFDHDSKQIAIGDYRGPDKMEININSDGFIDHNGGHTFTLNSSNKNHLIMMDILDGSQWFDFDGVDTTIEKVGPYINLLKETEFAPKSVYAEELCKIDIDSGKINYVFEDIYTTNEAIYNEVNNLIEEYESELSKQFIPQAIEIFEKMLVILKWVKNKWNPNEIPVWKIVLPTPQTLRNFNI